MALLELLVPLTPVLWLLLAGAVVVVTLEATVEKARVSFSNYKKVKTRGNINYGQGSTQFYHNTLTIIGSTAFKL